jgi:hypothetical protein
MQVKNSLERILDDLYDGSIDLDSHCDRHQINTRPMLSIAVSKHTPGDLP